MKTKYLRILALAEGCTFLILLFVAMPWRALTHDPRPVRLMGLLHGLLFLMLMITMLSVANEEKWRARQTWLGVISAVIPFGPFWFERKYLATTKSSTRSGDRVDID